MSFVVLLILNKILQEASCTEAGYEDKLCSTCKATDSTVYPAKGHTDANNDSICDVCNSSTKLEADKGGLLQKIADFFNKIFGNKRIYVDIA